MDRAEDAQEKFAAPGGRGFTAINHHLKLGLPRATRQAASKAICSWGPKGADKGILRSVASNKQ
jgi:hypothetical protein